MLKLSSTEESHESWPGVKDEIMHNIKGIFILYNIY